MVKLLFLTGHQRFVTGHAHELIANIKEQMAREQLSVVQLKDAKAVYVKTEDSFVLMLDYRKDGRLLRAGDRLCGC